MNFWVQDGTRQTYLLCSDHLQLIFITRRFQNCKFTSELKFICNSKTNTPALLWSFMSKNRAANSKLPNVHIPSESRR